MLSPPLKMLTLSCRSSFATIFSGWLSRQRAEKYRFSSSKKIHASVGSVAGFAFVGNLLLEVLDGECGEVDLLVELPVDLQRALETSGAQDDASAFVAGCDFRRHRWHCTVE